MLVFHSLHISITHIHTHTHTHTHTHSERYVGSGIVFRLLVVSLIGSSEAAVTEFRLYTHTHTHAHTHVHIQDIHRYEK